MTIGTCFHFLFEIWTKKKLTSSLIPISSNLLWKTFGSMLKKNCVPSWEMFPKPRQSSRVATSRANLTPVSLKTLFSAIAFKRQIFLFSLVLRVSTPCYVGRSVGRSVVQLVGPLFTFRRFWAYGSCTDALVTFSSTVPAHLHATRVAMYPDRIGFIQNGGGIMSKEGRLATENCLLQRFNKLWKLSVSW